VLPVVAYLAAFRWALDRGYRYIIEMETAVERLLRLTSDPPPVIFHDGSFVLSFAGRMPLATRDAYLQPLFTLLDQSRQRRIPIAGYVDSSLASDLTAMLRHVFDLPEHTVPDGAMLATRLEPLDRTAAFRSARGDILPHYRREQRDYAQDLCFLYLQTGHDRLPARIECAHADANRVTSSDFTGRWRDNYASNGRRR